MNGRAAKLHRQTAQQGAAKAISAVVPALKAIASAEEQTRERVEAMENLLRRGFRGRLRWLFLGR